jgi:hypothetical protein
MNLARFATNRIALFFSMHKCHDGPMQGAGLALSEHSPNTAWIEVNGRVGRYVTDKRGNLVWQSREAE